jgi:hypothetical protein
MAMGARIRLATLNLKAAITKDGASRCAKRINTEAVDTARIAMIMANGKAIRGRSSIKVSPADENVALL